MILFLFFIYFYQFDIINKTDSCFDSSFMNVNIDSTMVIPDSTKSNCLSIL